MLDPNDSKTTPFEFFKDQPAVAAVPLEVEEVAEVVQVEQPVGVASVADRQRKLRQNRKANGIKPVHMSPADRELTAKALRLFGRVSFSPERASGDVAVLLGRVAPGGPQGQELDDFALLEVGDADLQPHWESYRSDFARAATALGMLRLRNNQHAELVRAVHTLQGHLIEAGLEDQALGGRGDWYWNKTPLRDYRNEGAPEYMERQSAGLSVFDERDQLACEVEHLRQEREQFSAQLAESRRYSYEREQALKRELAEVEAWGEHYRRQRDGKQGEIENLLGVVRGLQELAEELGGPAVKMTPRPAPAAGQPAGVLDLAQLNESELELLKGALDEYHKKNKVVLWKDVACESLWKRLTLLQFNQVEPQADPFTRWGNDPAWSKTALQVAAVEARQALAEGLAQPEVVESVTAGCDRRNLATFCNNKNVKTVQLRSYSEGVRNEFLGDVVQMCAECRKANNGAFKILKPGR